MAPRRARRSGARREPLLLLWSEEALRNLSEIGEYLSAAGAPTAAKWTLRLARAPERLRTMPLSGRVVPEFMNADIREVIVGPYRIVYRLQAGQILVAHVFHGKQALPKSIGGGKSASLH